MTEPTRKIRGISFSDFWRLLLCRILDTRNVNSPWQAVSPFTEQQLYCSRFHSFQLRLGWFAWLQWKFKKKQIKVDERAPEWPRSKVCLVSWIIKGWVGEQERRMRPSPMELQSSVLLCQPCLLLSSRATPATEGTFVLLLTNTVSHWEPDSLPLPNKAPQIPGWKCQRDVSLIPGKQAGFALWGHLGLHICRARGGYWEVQPDRNSLSSLSISPVSPSFSTAL